MQKEITKRKLNNKIAAVISVLLVIVILCLLCLPEKKEKRYDMVFLGDSVVGNVWMHPGITDVMEERLGKTVFNGAFGGTRMSFWNENSQGSRASSEWCMVRLAQAICNDDWGSQLATVSYANHYQMTNTQALDYFYDRMIQLSQIDFEQVEILLIEHGTNDYNVGRPLDNPENAFDETTFGGALRSSLALLQKTYPQMHIILVTPIYCEIGENKCYNTDYGGGYLDDYVALEKQIAAEFGVEVIDAYHESGIWEENVDVYLPDRLHPSEAGHALLGNFIADYLLEYTD